MESFPIEKYKFYRHNDDMIAVSTYAGREVKGRAHLAAMDTFDMELGKQIAAAKCNLKVAKKRKERAARKWLAAKELLMYANQEMARMDAYYRDADDALDEAKQMLHSVLEKA